MKFVEHLGSTSGLKSNEKFLKLYRNNNFSFLIGANTQRYSIILFKVISFLGGLRVTNPPIRLMCPTSICLSTFFVSGL